MLSRSGLRAAQSILRHGTGTFYFLAVLAIDSSREQGWTPWHQGLEKVLSQARHFFRTFAPSLASGIDYGLLNYLVWDGSYENPSTKCRLEGRSLSPVSPKHV